MTLNAAIFLEIKVSIMLTVFVMGLNFALGELAYLARHPRKFLRSLVAMDIIMPAFAIAVVALFSLPVPVKIALVALSVSPTPPILPNKVAKLGGTQAYIASLLVSIAAIALAFVPAALWLTGRILGVETRMPVAAVLDILGMTIFLPLTAGLVARQLWPGVAERLSKPLAVTATVLLALGVIALLAGGAWRAVLAQMHNGAVLAFAAFVLVGLAIGHWLGGPERGDRIVLSLATASRHPGLAVAIAQANFPNQKGALGAVILYLLVNVVVGAPYAMWRKRQKAAVGDSF